MNNSSNKKSRHTSPSGITHVKRPRDSPEFWLTEAKACCDPGYFMGPPHTWLRWPLPLVISSWGLKSSPHRDTQISAKNKIRMLPAIARSTKQPYVLLDNLLHSYNNIPQGTCKHSNFCDFSSYFDIYASSGHLSCVKHHCFTSSLSITARQHGTYLLS